MSGLYAELDWPSTSEALRDDWIPSTTTAVQKWYKEDYNRIFKSSVLDCARSLGLEPDFVLVFYQKGGVFTSKHIHIDGAGGHFLFGVNWIVAESTLMQWYSATPPKLPLKGLNEGLRYANFLEKDCELIGECTSLGPIVVNVNTPHRANNLGRTDRYAYSLRFKNTFNSWDEMIKVFRPHLKQ